MLSSERREHVRLVRRDEGLNIISLRPRVVSLKCRSEVLCYKEQLYCIIMVSKQAEATISALITTGTAISTIISE